VKVDWWSEGYFVIADLIRGQWSPGNRDKEVFAAARMDGKQCFVVIEEELGASGKSVIHYYQKKMRGWTVYGIKPSGNKAVRAQPFAAASEDGKVLLARANWNTPLLDEMSVWPKGATLDQVDALAHAFNFLDNMGDYWHGGDILTSGDGDAAEIAEEHMILTDDELDELGGDLADIVRGGREDQPLQRRQPRTFD
jgi:predicted phage terminase large subunit-like protein